MDNIEKSLSDLKLSIIIAVLVSFIVASIFFWVIMIRKIDDVKIIADEIERKTIDYTLIAN